MNTAFLAKLGWRIMTEENSLWAIIMANKYMIGNCELGRIRPKTGQSNAWKGIVEGIEILKNDGKDCQGMEETHHSGQALGSWMNLLSITPLATLQRMICM